VEWRKGRERFYPIPEDATELRRYWAAYERLRERAGADAVRSRAVEIAEIEFGTA